MSYIFQKAFRSTAAALAFVTAGAGASAVRAQSLGDLMNQEAAASTQIKLLIACGNVKKENCAVAVPALQDKLPSNYTLNEALADGSNPGKTGGSVQSMDALCNDKYKDIVKLAIVQADAYYKRTSLPDDGQLNCSKKVQIIGQPLYPYYGFPIVSAKLMKSVSNIDEAIAQLPKGQTLKVGTGGKGSGGDLTFRIMEAEHPNWADRVEITNDGAGGEEGIKRALDRLETGELDVLFMNDAQSSPMMKVVKEAKNDQKEQKFKFLAVVPSYYLQNYKLTKQFKLYAQANLVPGGWFGGSVDGASTPAILVGRMDLDAGIVNQLAAATRDAQSSIAAKAGAPIGWMNNFKLNY